MNLTSLGYFFNFFHKVQQNCSVKTKNVIKATMFMYAFHDKFRLSWKILFVLLLVASFCTNCLHNLTDSQGEVRKSIHPDFDLFPIRFSCRKCQT